MRRVRDWLERFSFILKAARPEKATAFSDTLPLGRDTITPTRRPTDLQIKIDDMLRLKDSYHKAYNPDIVPRPNAILLGFWPAEKDKTPLNTVSRTLPETDNERFQFSIRNTMTAPLELDEQKSGYLYAYEVGGSPGLVKIGYSVDALLRRATRSGQKPATGKRYFCTL
ncbi:hypothetical protein LTR86_010424 [Recurvomyces mirabilis]|nr:hypothetical protein LTR86_010424 [Recurvomyces mirabilis]